MNKIIMAGLLTLMGCSTFAKNSALADNSPSEKTILENSVVTTAAQLMNAKHEGKCVIPSQDKDVHWMCLGALFPVKEPTITPNTCGFEVEVVCPGETAKIYGKRTSYFLQMPQGETTTVKPSAATITFDQMMIVGQ